MCNQCFTCGLGVCQYDLRSERTCNSIAGTFSCSRSFSHLTPHLLSDGHTHMNSGIQWLQDCKVISHFPVCIFIVYLVYILQFLGRVSLFVYILPLGLAILTLWITLQTDPLPSFPVCNFCLISSAFHFASAPSSSVWWILQHNSALPFSHYL